MNDPVVYTVHRGDRCIGGVRVMKNGYKAFRNGEVLGTFDTLIEAWTKVTSADLMADPVFRSSIGAAP